jgi:metallo-beta-lactamase class B
MARILFVVLAACLSIASLRLPAQQHTTAAPRLDTSTWNDPMPPFRVAGPIHYVGTRELGAFLFVTPNGHILLDGGLPSSASIIERSIRTLGHDPKDIRVLLISQAHFDHVGSLAHFKRASGARVEIMQGDDTLVEDGGKSDYLLAHDPAYHFEPVKVDRVLRDGDVVSLGGVRLTARRTPGHTPGCTTWITEVDEAGKSYRVVFAGSTTVNPGTRLVDRPSYPGIADDFRRTFRILERLQPDIFLAAHGGFFGLVEKHARLATDGVQAFVDPDGYRELISARKRAFDDLVAKETASSN